MHGSASAASPARIWCAASRTSRAKGYDAAPGRSDHRPVVAPVVRRSPARRIRPSPSTPRWSPSSTHGRQERDLVRADTGVRVWFGSARCGL